MISISTLYCGRRLPSHRLRYGRPSEAGPVVVYNCTARCNLACAHCYSASTAAAPGDELSTPEAKRLLDDLAALGTPVVLFSGGEPTLREDLPDLVAHAAGAGVRAVISSNGTTITPAAARRLADAGAAYVGVSIDGTEQTHDSFRGYTGSFAAAMTGIDACRHAGVKVGLRMTLTRRNAAQIEDVFGLLTAHEIPRVCFYHLVYAGRGAGLRGDDLSPDQRRDALDRIMGLAAAHEQVEVLTVDNHADGPYVYLRLLREDPARAPEALDLLRANRGNASGVRLACVRPNGDVLPDQFSDGQRLGNVGDRPFGEIWTDGSSELLAGLRRFPRQVTGRCGRCRWLEVCNANLRARAEAATGDFWASDPSCQLTDEEIRPPA